MNGEKDEFLFLESRERREVVFIFFYGMVSWRLGWLIVNKLQKFDRVDGVIDNLVDRVDDWVSQFEENSKLILLFD